MPHPRRGGIYPYNSIRRGHFLVVSLDLLNRVAGLAVVVEVVSEPPPEDPRALLAVQLTATDPMPGSWALCWRLNYTRTDRLDVDNRPGQVGAETMDRVTAGIRAVVEP